MRLTTTAADLRDAFAAARQATPGNPALIAYAGIHVDVSGDEATLTGSDGDTTISRRIAVSEPQDGSTLLLPKPLGAYLSTLDKATPVCLRSKENGDVEVQAGRSSPYAFRPLAATFPRTPVTPGKPVSFPADQLAAAVAAVRCAVPRDNPAVRVESGKQGLTLCTTDSYRLAQALIPRASMGEFTIVVALSVLERGVRMGLDKAVFEPGSRVLCLASSNTTVTSRMLAAPFPAVDTILGSKPRSGIRIPVATARLCLARLASIAEKSPLRVRISGDTMSLHVSNIDLGSGEEVVPLAEAAAQDIEFLVRLSYLHEALDAVSAEEADLSYSGPVSPVFVTSSGPVTSTHVVMPVRA